MKTRASALLFCLLLLVQISAFPVQASSQVYFTAVNANVLPLTEESMPFWKDRHLYVDSSIFTMAKNTPGRLLGIYRSLNTAKGLLVLSAEGRSLIFDLEKKTVQDNEGIAYSPGAIQRGGRVFVPISLVAYFFHLIYSSTRVDLEGSYHGYLVRIRNDKSAIPDDSEFIQAAEHLMVNRYGEYLKSQNSGGTFDPEENRDEPEHEETQSPAQREKTLYLCFQAEEPTAVAGLLDILERYDTTAAFYCTEAFLQEQGGLVRRMYSAGHSIGLLASSTGKENLLDTLERGNAALERATCTRTRLVRVSGAVEQERQQAEAAGYHLLKVDMDRSSYPLTTSSAAAALLDRAEQRRGSVRIWLGGGTTPAGLTAFLSEAHREGHRCLSVTELT